MGQKTAFNKKTHLIDSTHIRWKSCEYFGRSSATYQAEAEKIPPSVSLSHRHCPCRYTWEHRTHVYLIERLRTRSTWHEAHRKTELPPGVSSRVNSWWRRRTCVEDVFVPPGVSPQPILKRDKRGYFYNGSTGMLPEVKHRLAWNEVFMLPHSSLEGPLLCRATVRQLNNCAVCIDIIFSLSICCEISDTINFTDPALISREYTTCTEWCPRE